MVPGPRDEWYSASALSARALYVGRHPGAAGRRPSLSAWAPASVRSPCWVDQRRAPGKFAGLFQVGQLFMPRFDRQESAFVRYERIVRVVR